MFSQAIVVLSFLGAAFSSPTLGERIVNGTDALLGDIPFIVSLRVFDEHICGASILTARHIVTAAHCVDIYMPVEIFSVQYGLIDITTSNSPNVILAESFIYHPQYSEHGYIFDVAVMKLKSKIPFSTYVQPVQLPHAFNATPENSVALLSGWGYPHSDGSHMTKLQKVNISVYTDDDCERIHANTGPTNRFNHICAGNPEGGKGQCTLDSGGPLIVDNQLVGIVSWSVKPCAVKGFPGVFTKVSNVLIWIIEQITEL